MHIQMCMTVGLFFNPTSLAKLKATMRETSKYI